MRFGWLFWWRPPAMLRRVIVNLKHDPTSAIQGALWSSRGAWLTFRDCSGLKAGQNATPIDGDVLIHRDNIAFLQVLP
jgi:hypothetical protein